jgi:hypothetical protein
MLHGRTEIAGFQPKLYKTLQKMASKTTSYTHEIKGFGVVQGELISQWRVTTCIYPNETVQCNNSLKNMNLKGRKMRFSAICCRTWEASPNASSSKSQFAAELGGRDRPRGLIPKGKGAIMPQA